MVDLPSAVLENGVRIPLLGLGTFKLKDPKTLTTVVSAALKNGYRLIDTATVYRNESAIGCALQELSSQYNIKPEDVFITTKLAPRDHGYSTTLSSFESSLASLGRTSLDLYLIHWPGVQGKKREDPQNAVIRKESWRALEDLYRNGKVRAIGVSNYTVRHLEELVQYATIKPHVLQSECHPMLAQKELRAYCKKHGIFFQAYSSLGCGQLLQNDTVLKLARNYDKKTPAQFLLRWAVQQGIGVIPKASSEARVEENCKIFDFQISDRDMELMEKDFDSLHHFCWDPTDVA